MRIVHFTLAALVGIVVSQALVMSSGYFAALALPPGYLEFFGRANRFAGMWLWDVVSFAIPQFLLAAALSWLTFRLLGSANGTAVSLAIGWLSLFVAYISVLPQADGSLAFADMGRVGRLLFAMYVANPELWASSWSVPAGLCLGWWLHRRSTSTPRH